MIKLVIRSLSLAAVLGANSAIGTVVASPANAEPPVQVVVSYADLNLNSPAGIDVMRNRLEAASRQVCGPEPIARAFNDHKAYEDCVKSTYDHAINSVPDAQAYNLRHGTPEVLGSK